MSDELNPWNVVSPHIDVQVQSFPDEQDRWAALLDEPLGLFRNPLKYGPLTVSGYLKARRYSKTRGNESWPKEPASIALLLKTCGITEEDAAFIAMSHLPYLDETLGTDEPQLFTLHLEILKNLGVSPSPKALLEAVKDVEWRDTEFASFYYSFEVMKDYLPTAQDETHFLSKWLPSLAYSSQTSGLNESIGLAIAAIFNRSEAEPIIEWCKKNDDMPGLAYLVWQNRMQFSDFLCEIAEPSAPMRERGYGSVEHDVKECRSEQLGTLRMLGYRLEEDVLRNESAVFRNEHSAQFMKLVTHVNGSKDNEERTQWYLELLRSKVITVEHPVFLEWIDSSIRVQDKVISELSIGRIGNGSVESSYDNVSAFNNWKPFVDAKNERLRHFLARELVLTMSHTQARIYLADMDIGWMKGTPIAPVLLARKKGGQPGYGEVMSGLYPFLAEADKKMIALEIIDAAFNGKLNILNAVHLCSKVDPVNFPAFKNSKHQDIALLLQHLTQKDPKSLFSSMATLEVMSNDPLYKEMIYQWFDNNFDSKKLDIEVPRDFSDSVLGF